MKLDIEGSEYDFLSIVSDQQLKNIKQIIIEIHKPIIFDRIELLQKLILYHTLIHIHGNNCCETIIMDGIHIPSVMELSFVRNKDLPKNEPIYPNMSKLPSPLDQPNLNNKKDFVLDYYPFVKN